MGIFEWLFDASAFSTRGQCGDWGEWLPVVYRLASFATALSYSIIPAPLCWLYARKRGVLPKPWVLVLFAAFITLCGATHALDFAAFFWPAYRFFTLVEVATAAVSLATAAALPWAVYHVVALPTPEEFRAAKKRLESEEAARVEAQSRLLRRNAELREAVEAMRVEFDAIQFKELTATECQKLRDILQRIGGG